jgi:hypothetical protein
VTETPDTVFIRVHIASPDPLCDGRFEEAELPEMVRAAGLSARWRHSGGAVVLDVVGHLADFIGVGAALIGLGQLISKVCNHQQLKHSKRTIKLTSEVAALALCMVDADGRPNVRLAGVEWKVSSFDTGYVVVAYQHSPPDLNAVYLVTTSGELKAACPFVWRS